MKNYRVRTACEIAGRWHEANAEIPLSDDQARELAPPFGGVVVLVSEEKDISDAKLDRRKRGDGPSAE